MNNQSKALKAGIWYTISNFFVKGITFLTMPIFTRLMTQNEIGAFSNITAWFSILAIITTFELSSSVTLAKFDYKDKIDSYISSNLFLGTLITGIIYMIVVVFKDFFKAFFSMSETTIHIIFIYLLVYPAIQMFQVKSRIEYNYKASVLVSIGSSLLSTIIAVISVLIFNDKLNARIYGFYLSLIVISLIIYIYLMYKGKCISSKYWKYSLTISFPLIWHLLAGNVLSSSDRIMITKIVGDSENALYTMAYTCSMFVSMLWNSMNTAWSPWAYDMLNQKEYNQLNRKSKPYFIFFLFVVMIFMLFAPELLYIMGGQEYLIAVYVIPPVMVGYIFQFVYSLYVNIETYNKKQNYIAAGTIIAAIINIVLNLIFIPIFGYMAAAYTTLISYISLFIIHYLLVRKIKCDNCYDVKFFLKYLIISITFIPISTVIYYYNTLRYLMIGIVTIITILVIVKNKEIIIQSWKDKSIKPIMNLIIGNNE